MDVHIREQNLPGIGHRYDVSVPGGRRLTVVVQRSGRREIAIGRVGSDVAESAISLSHEQAVAVAAILTGARFSIESDPDRDSPVGDVVVETLTLSEGSPAIGLLAREVPLLTGADAAILAVIRDDTPQLLEDGSTEPCRVGDRVVVAARRSRLVDVIHDLAG